MNQQQYVYDQNGNLVPATPAFAAPTQLAPFNEQSLAVYQQFATELPLMDTYTGPTFNRIKLADGRFYLIKAGEDEQLYPSLTMDVVILAWRDKIGRRWYGPDVWTKGKKGRPHCWSDDGNTPLGPIESRPQDLIAVGQPVSSCATCSKNVKGSAVSGGDYKGCQYYKRLVVTFADAQTFEPFVLDVTGMGLFGEADMARNIFSLQGGKGAPSSLIKFLAQPRTAFPHGISPWLVKVRLSIEGKALRFQPIDMVPHERVPEIKALATDDTVKMLVALDANAEQDDRNQGAPALSAPAITTAPPTAQAAPPAIQPAPPSVAASAPSFVAPPVAPPPPLAAPVPPRAKTLEEILADNVDMWLQNPAVPAQVQEWASNPAVSDQMISDYLTQNYPQVTAAPVKPVAPPPPPPMVTPTASAPGMGATMQAIKPAEANDGSGLDARGLPWDARIHATTKTKTADGAWRALRGVTKELVEQVEAELLGKSQGVSAPTTPAVSAPPPAQHMGQEHGNTATGGPKGSISDQVRALAGAAFDV